MEKLLTQKEVAHQLGISERTLERHRVTGTGPRSVRLGRSSVSGFGSRGLGRVVGSSFDIKTGPPNSTDNRRILRRTGRCAGAQKFGQSVMSDAELKGALALADLVRDLALAKDRRKKRFAAIVRFVRRREASGP